MALSAVAMVRAGRSVLTLATRAGQLTPLVGRRGFAATATGPLAGLRILDLSRILAGPSATMLLGDMGAKVVKIERPKSGDDTRRYAPPYLQKNSEEDSEIAAYFASCNRNKFSVALNFTTKEGQAVLHRLLESSDVVIENFKTGTLDKYGLGYKQLKETYPGLVYCSITGFGHSGPYKARPAYDMLIQAMGGSMSLTGVPDGEPMKMGLSMFDLTAGLHAVIGILAALRSKAETGLGQHVDISMLDVSVALLQNQGMNFLAKKQRQARVGNNHPNVVPYQVMPTSDGHFILTASNDEQFQRFCRVAGAEELIEDEKFSTMKARVVNRAEVTPALNEITKKRTTNWWLEHLEKSGVGCAPILHLDEVFADPHVQARNMEIKMQVPGSEQPISLIGSPMKFSRTEVDYRIPPSRLGEHTDRVLMEHGYSAMEIYEMRELGCVGEQPPPLPVMFEEQVAQLDKADEGAAQTGAVIGGNWDKVKSISVPNASAFVNEAEEQRAKQAQSEQRDSKLLGRKWGGGAWDKVRSISVPNASAFLNEQAESQPPQPGAPDGKSTQ